MDFLSVASGIEAASVAFGPLGWRAVGFAEIEPFPCAVLAHHYPDVPNVGDMRRLPQLIRDGAAPAPDVLCGGPPCQGFSTAGLRRSLDDERGLLTLTFCDIANAIDSVRAARGEPDSVILWENVAGVLSTKDNAFGCFLAGLAGEDVPLEPPGRRWENAGAVLGPKRAVAWRTLDAQYFGLAQRRRRVFVVASARHGFDPLAVLFEQQGVRRDTAPRRKAGQGAAAGTLRSTDGGDVDVDHVRAGHVCAVAFGGNNTAGPIEVATAQSASGSASGRLDFESETFIVAPLDASLGRLQGCGGQDANHGHSHLVVTHSLRGTGFDASGDGTGRGTPPAGTSAPVRSTSIRTRRRWRSTRRRSRATRTGPTPSPAIRATRSWRMRTRQRWYSKNAT